MLRSTFVVSDGLASRHLRDQFAYQRLLGQRVVTLQGLAARLAGGLGGVASASSVRQALQSPPIDQLPTLGAIATLPGFARAATSTLFAAWNAGLELNQLASAPGAHPRWSELLALQTHVRSQLPAGTYLPQEVVAAAATRLDLAPRLVGNLVLYGLYDVPLLFRPLLTQLASRVSVEWRLPATHDPPWHAPGVRRVSAPAGSAVLAIESCADPYHEAVEALRWVRRLLVSGVPAADIAVAAVDVATYDSAMVTLTQSSGLPIHFAHGLPNTSTSAGQFASAMAEALLNGPTQPRVQRIVHAARAAKDITLGGLAADWCQEIEPDAALTTVALWRRALEPLQQRQPETAKLMLRLVMDLSQGHEAALTVGARWLSGSAREAWRRALADGSAEALTSTLEGQRVNDARDPACSVLWVSASTLIGWPRSHVRLLGLSARSWPRRSSDEDPLLPYRVLKPYRLNERSRARIDADHLKILVAQTSSSVVLSRPRRGSDGRSQTPSPLLNAYLTDMPEREVIPKQGTQHALSEADRRASCRSELARDSAVLRCKSAFRSAFSPQLTRHDGLVRANHPVVERTIQRRHSATSLKLLLRNPHGFVATYGLGWAQPEPQQGLLELDALQRGQLLHEVLEDSLARVQTAGGLSRVEQDEVVTLVREACHSAGRRWEVTRPVPPPLAWKAALQRAETMAIHMLTVTTNLAPDVRSYAELKFGYDDSHASSNAELPWQPNATVTLPGTDLRLRGVIDRLDIDDEQRRITVMDYKSGKPRNHDGDLDGGNELQRTLYTVAVQQLLGTDYEVQAGLLYAGAVAPDTLSQPELSVQRLIAAATAAVARLKAGSVLAGPGVTDAFEATVLAYPAAGPGYYYRIKGGSIDADRAPIDAALATPGVATTDAAEGGLEA